MKVPSSLLVLLVAALVAMGGPVEAQRFKWWHSEQVQKDLGLTADQVARINNIFEAAMPRMRQSIDELTKQEAELSRLIEADADESQVTRQVDRIEAIRSSLNKARTLQILHMRQVLTPEQRVRFKAMLDQMDRARGQRGPGPGPGDRHGGPR